MFEFQFETTPEDYFEANKHHVHYGPSSKRIMRRLRIMCAVVFLLFAATYAVTFRWLSQVDRVAYAVALAVIAFFCLIFPTTGIDWLIKRTIASAVKDGKLYDVGRKTYCFGEDMFTCTTRATQTLQNAYAALERVDAGETAVYLYDGACQAYILPNRIFASEEEKSRFISFIQDKISESRG